MPDSALTVHGGHEAAPAAAKGRDVQAILAAGERLAHTLVAALDASLEARHAVESVGEELRERLARVESALAELARSGGRPQAPPDAPLPLLLSVDDVARLMSVSGRQLRRMQAQGRLPTALRLAPAPRRSAPQAGDESDQRKPGKGKIRWRRELILAWIAAGTPEPEKWQSKWEAEHPAEV